MRRSPKAVANWIGGIAVLVAVALCAGVVGAGADKANRIHRIAVREQNGTTTVVVEGSASPKYSAFRLSSPKRLVIDLANSHVRGVPSLLDSSTQIVQGVAVSEYSVGGAPVSRIMINFKEDASYRVRPRGDSLVITLNGGPENKYADTPIVASAPKAAPSDKATPKEVERLKEQARREVAKAKKRQEKEMAQLKKQARQEVAEAKKLQQKALKEAAEARRMQEEAKTAFSKAEKMQTKASEEIARARKLKNKAQDDAKLARSRMKAARQDADKAQLEQTEIKGELSSLRDRSRSLKSGASKAKEQAEQAQKRLAEIRRQLKKEAKKNLLAKREVEAAENNADRNRLAAKKARQRAEQQEASRAKLERQVGRLKKQLVRAQKENTEAKEAYTMAEKMVGKLEDQLQAKKSEQQLAAEQAGRALEERKQALEAYKQAAESEKKALLAVLKEKEELSSDAAKRLYRVEQENRKAKTALFMARKGAENAKNSSREAASAENELKKRAGDKIAALEQQRNEAIAEAARAEQMADDAVQAKNAAEKKLAAIEKKFKNRLKKVEGEASEELAMAQSRFEKAVAAQDRHDKKLAKLEKQLAQVKEHSLKAEALAKHEAQKAQKFELQLASAKKKIDSANKDLAETNKKADKYEKQLASAKKKIKEAKRNIAKTNQKVTEQEQRIAQLAQRAEKAEQARADAQKVAESTAAESKVIRSENDELRKAAQAAKKDARLAKRDAKKARIEASQARNEAKAAAKSAQAPKAAEPKVKEPTIAERDRLIDLQLASLRAKGRTLSKAERRRLARLKAMRAGKAEKPRKEDTSTKQVRQTEPAELDEDTQPLITDIKFVPDKGSQKMVIYSNMPLEYHMFDDARGNATMVLDEVALAPVLERTLDVGELGGILGKIHSYQADGKSQIEVEVAARAKNTVARNGSVLEWTFTPIAAKNDGPRAFVGDKRLASRTVFKEDEQTYAYPYERTAADSVVSSRSGKKRYSGRRIDLDFRDADIHNILRLLSDVGHVNIITSDDVKGSVTIRMRDVAWDHALDVILQTKRLGMVRRGNLIRVAPMDALEKEREMEIARRKQKIALEPLETRLIPVSYATARELQPRAQDLLTERGKLSVDERTNVIIARDTVGTLNQVESLVRSLDTQTPQVLIEGRIVEASSTYSREIGIQWGGDFAASSATGNPTGLAFPSTLGVAGGATDQQTPVAGLNPLAGGTANPNFAVNMPAAVGTGSGGALGITLGSIANNANLNLRLSAMEESGTLRILSSPKILTLDNREAYIEQGTLIPYSQVAATGVMTAFKEAKLNLTVTPHVTADGSVLLDLQLMRDEPDFNNTGARGDPTILKREAQTELLVSDGHTAVIGGIFTRNHGMGYKKVPLLADIPIIGWLFKTRSVSDRRSEMLIFITPRIVNRAQSIGN